MTNIKKQHCLDKAKYLESEHLKTDLSGNMSYCDFCEQQVNFKCQATQLDREMNCLCAKAYNKKARNKNEKKDNCV